MAPSNVNASVKRGKTIAGLVELEKILKRANRDFTRGSLDILTKAGARYAPVGVEGNSTNPPGDLANSIVATPTTDLFGGAIAGGLTGPTKVYGRQRELGGHIYAGQTARSVGSIDHPRGTGRQAGAKYLRFRIFGRKFTTLHVYQIPHPYMATAYMQSRDEIHRYAIERMSEAVTGGQ